MLRLGVSMERRMLEAHAFLAAALGGGLTEPVDLPLTEQEEAFAAWTFGGQMPVCVPGWPTHCATHSPRLLGSPTAW